MLVGERMTHPVLTISPEMPVQDALSRMKKDKVHRYPVVDQRGTLVGIVTESDLMNASPSDATTLSVWEINYLLAKITVERVMATKVVTVNVDTTIEEAARMMADLKYGGLPVMKGDNLVGIITETDLFNIFIEMLGARSAGIRVTVEVKDEPGKLSQMATAISQLGGNIHGVGAILGESAGTNTLTMKVTGVKQDDLQKAISSLVIKILDIREEKGG